MKDLQFIYGLCKLSRPLEPASGRGVGCWREKRDVAGGLRLALPRAPRTNATLREPRTRQPQPHKTFTSQTIARLIAAARVATPRRYLSITSTCMLPS